MNTFFHSTEKIISGLSNGTVLPMMVNGYASILIKTDRRAISSIRGPIKIGYRPILGTFPTGAVVYLEFEFFVKPDNSWIADAFLNLNTAEDLTLFQTLTTQTLLHFHFFDSSGKYRLTKQISHRSLASEQELHILDTAMKHNKSLSSVDFETAKKQMISEMVIEMV